MKVGSKKEEEEEGGVNKEDGERESATDFQQVFPYLNTPLPGAK